MIDLYRLKNRFRLFLPGSSFPWLANFKDFGAHPNNILCVTAAGLGDVIMDAPAIHALKQKFPDAKLSVLGHHNRRTDEICRLMKSVDETIDLGLRDYRWASIIRFMCGRFWKLLFSLRKRRFDLAVVFWPNPIRRLLLAGLGSKYWIYGSLTEGYPGEQNLRLLQLAGIEDIDDESVFEIPEPANADQILPDTMARPWIGVHPFCGTAWRQWNKFDTLREELGKLSGSIVVVGRKEGYELEGPGRNLVNKLSIAELFWVIRQCDVFVTADSGPMHIAFAVRTPTVALFGPVRPDVRVPPAERNKHRIFYKQSAASDKTSWVGQRTRRDNAEMQEIAVEEVLQAIKELSGDCLQAGQKLDAT